MFKQQVRFADSVEEQSSNVTTRTTMHRTCLQFRSNNPPTNVMTDKTLTNGEVEKAQDIDKNRRGKKVLKKGSHKSAAQKALEDQEAKANDVDKKLRGTNKRLHDMGTTMDPPAWHFVVPTTQPLEDVAAKIGHEEGARVINGEGVSNGNLSGMLHFNLPLYEAYGVSLLHGPWTHCISHFPLFASEEHQ
ncbi:hypothetical protein M422DRAFT_250459 [Sphaerobolus stellatus SS14]|uniref:Uncharacterized protein n=1 Tax=Sphaerobolus stellatus (strain SS14) TaxID=990650 RepID=A0A0C9W2X5_SPHS4|nr:hypothetical protein M422DRAFT_250459 [Sphaerobolus stellatus SS14]